MVDDKKLNNDDKDDFNPLLAGLILKKILMAMQTGDGLKEQLLNQPSELRPSEIFTVINGDITNESIYGLYEAFEVLPASLVLYMNSSCSNIYNGVTVYNVLKGLKCNTIAVNTGIVSGAALLAFIGARHRYCLPLTSFYFTDFTVDEELKNKIKNDDERKACMGDLRNKLVSAFTERTKGEEGVWIKSLAGRSFTAQEAEEIGIVNKVIERLE